MTDAAIGHNRPPPTEQEEFLHNLTDRHEGLTDKQVDLLLDAARLPTEVTSDDDVAKINEWIVRARALAREVEGLRESEKAPYLQRGRWVDGFFSAIRDGLTDRAKSTEQRLVPYLRAKREAEEAARKAEAEEAARVAKEAADKLAAEQAAARKAEEEAEAAQRAIKEAADAEALAAAQEIARQAHVAAQQAQKAEEEAAKASAATEKKAEVAERMVDVGSKAKTTGGGGSAAIRETWNWRWEKPLETKASLGPLGHFLPEDAIKVAITKALRADPRPDIPGVTWYKEAVARTTATKPKN